MACDQRGYGRSSAPDGVDQYTLCHLAGDIVGLVSALGESRAAIVGHDWGSPVAWTCALLRPDIFHSVCLMSVPFLPFTIGQPRITDQLRAAFGDREFYQLYFQEPGKAEKELEEDVRVALLKLLCAGSGDAPPDGSFRFVFERGERFIDAHPVPGSLPAWLTEEDLQYFSQEFERTGFRGGLNWYRNLDRDYELLAGLAGAALRQPTLFIAGERDVCIEMYRDAFNSMESTAPQLAGRHLLSGAGHWIQQERPAEVNELLLAFLQDHGRLTQSFAAASSTPTGGSPQSSG